MSLQASWQESEIKLYYGRRIEHHRERQASLQQPDSALAAWASDFLQQQQLGQSTLGQSTAPQVVAPQVGLHQEHERSMDTQMAGVAGLPQGIFLCPRFFF